ncbi:N-acetylmuramoyl-L-alanine amidase [Paenibacillus methanolicus]|uniref:N-acetylmuramoyl-L-alanine amidase n=1 Tax=Paenibacillus methanolicus TaxID=582686 RepID=A0A5S5BPT1_9BACL|nr:N-acetylmuramoyl-L-alanine amidase [Paenibacillus methanolicus]TYP68356.1 N-acetylmuramoyl-L-alanine amidase [Paenibacillus methanolicus]
MKSIVSILIVVVLLLGAAFGAQAKSEAKQYYQVSADSLNVRNDPSEKGEVIASLRKGDVVEVSDEAHGWLQVALNKTSGWVAGYYLVKTGSGGGKTTVSSGSSGAKSSAQTVQADSLRMRKGPGTGYSVVGGLYKGEAVTVIDRDGDWVKVKTPDGQQGWVASQYIGEGGGSSSGSGDSSSSGRLNGKLIVLDPGHGGDDPGMIGKESEAQEKDLNLETAFILADYLRDLGARVILTRSEDVKPSLPERVKISENNGADAFISIHYNSSTKNTSGTLTFYNKGKDKALARAIESELAEGAGGLRSNGISFGDYHVLRENSQVSALVELGFLSNEKDERIVRTKDYKRKAAKAIADGLVDYFN